MKYIEYMQLNPFQRFWYNFSNAMKAFPGKLKNFFVAVGVLIANFFKGIGKAVAGYVTRFIKGDWAVKISYLIMGFGNMVKGQFIKGLLFLASEVAFIAYMVFFGWGYLSKFPTLGTEVPGMQLNPVTGGYEDVAGDNSMLILLYGVLTIVLIAIFFAIYFASTKSAYAVAQQVAAGEKPVSFKSEVKDLLDNKFHITLLAFPTLTISVFTILPLIFMILIAFTNYNSSHMPPGKLFTWVGLETFSEIFAMTEGASKGATFLELTKWTLIWAVFATVLNYLFGMILALMINKKGIKLKALWRTLFVITVAVPQFVTLLLMNQMLQADGAINVLLMNVLGLIDKPIMFLNSTALVARITVIVVNCWIGIPYTILITSGILMNIPADLYESATIDGAGPVRTFFSITLPYMLFVTTPYLITNFIGNINNFNVIYLLTAGGPGTENLYQAGYTDLLVTWLFNLTMNSLDYNLAAAVGILVFVVCATISLITFNLTKSAKNEEEFS
ncbi:MAG: sugar ABC transporter permease [Ruminococcus sp.]|nr:sugar ABC transporter permease [Ruminococcus sp.]